jgi:hypothetical protein
MFNIQNSETLMHSLKQTNIQSNTKMCSFDIKNMYTNLPLNELINIIHRALTHNNIPDNHENEIITLVKVILSQNYFQFNNEIISNLIMNFIHRMRV